jgi:GNAT superfamily N-acetyltransferase
MMYADQLLAQRLERAEARNNAAYVETRARLQPQVGAQWIEVGGAYALFDGPASPLTQTFGLGLFDKITSAELDQLADFFQTRQAPVLHEVSPLADPELLPLLLARGYQPLEYTSVLYRALAAGPLPPGPRHPALTTRLIDAGEAELWAATAAQGWGSESAELAAFIYSFGQITARSALAFVAELDGQPVATGALGLHEGVALLAGASTVPAARQQGAQAALLEARLRYAAAHGATVATMSALPGSQSQRNAEKQGFRLAYTRTKWQLAG